MNFMLIKLLRIALDRRITSVPLRVLAELRKHGKTRVPKEVDHELSSSHSAGLKTLRFARKWLEGENLTRHNGQWVLNSFLPPFPGLAYDRMFENLLSGRRLSPVSAYLAVCSDCPFDCRYCSAKLRKKGHLSTDQWKHIIDGLLQCGISIIGFTGGEPLLREDVPELIAYASSKGVATILFSSGVTLDGVKAKLLKEAGLWALCISLDSTDPAEMTKRRGSSEAFDTAVRALKLSRACGFYTMIGAVASRSFIERGDIQKLHRLAASLDVDEFRIVEPMPCGRNKDAEKDALLSAEHISELRRFHITANRRGSKPKMCCFNHIESPELFGCGGGTQHLYIDWAGEVCPCDFTPMSFGNASREDFPLIWERMSEAMGRPRRHCFIREHYKLINEESGGVFPLDQDLSVRICSRLDCGALPDYFKVVTGQE